ncbi:MAG: hypothetical protein HOW73_34640 [Polyangiaceae bacterium]|nr:hypothetical protein [Polyangiaceae bacterium]
MTMTLPDFGRDLDTGNGDIDPFGREVIGIEALAQALAARLETPAGSLPDDDEGEYGYDLAEEIGEALTAEQRAAIPGRVRLELEEDERVDRVQVQVIALTEDTVRLSIRVEPVLLGPFRFVVEIGKAATVVLSTTPEEP